MCQVSCIWICSSGQKVKMKKKTIHCYMLTFFVRENGKEIYQKYQNACYDVVVKEGGRHQTRISLVKDGAYYCYCAYVLRISRYQILREFNSIIMQTLPFVFVEKHGCWSREWKPAIGLIFHIVMQISHVLCWGQTLEKRQIAENRLVEILK